MPEAVLIDVANAIQAELAAEDFGIEVECELSYADVFQLLKKMSEKVLVHVVPWKSTVEIDATSSWEYTCVVDIVVRKKFTEGDQDYQRGRVDYAEVNRLIKLVQDIEEFFLPSQVVDGEEDENNGRQLSTLRDAAWKETEKKLDYLRSHLFKNDQFTGWVRVTYTVPRTAA